MSAILIREIGSYTITTDSDEAGLACNGLRATFCPAPKGSGLAMLVDTGCAGANGKRDYVGLTAEHYAVYTACRDAARARREAAAATARRQDLEDNAEYYAERKRLLAEAERFAGVNEGGEGYNPWRDQLDSLDQAHGRATDAEVRAAFGRR